MGRSTKKGPYIDERLARKIEEMNTAGAKKSIKTYARKCTISPDFVGHTFLVYNGKKFVSVYITESMVGHKLGEFSPTRVFKGHGATHKETAALT